ncbi:MAG: malate dehydrogenase [Chromatiales bacterium]|nr:malate dehydrogenase [Chromatiales bacterium]
MARSKDEQFIAAALRYHAQPVPGKLAIALTKPTETQRDLALAYTPGVAEPVRRIAADPATAYEYTAKGNLVGVITNGSAVLGLGNVGALAGKPVMEGKAVLFKRFAGIDVFDIEVEAETPQAFIDTVARIAPTFGGINLEDIAAPHCFEIEQALRSRLDIPVFHDDQHGTAVIVAAGLLNALQLVGKRLADVRIVCLGAGAAGIASVRLLNLLGVPRRNTIVVDRTGVIHTGRTDLSAHKLAVAVDTRRRTLMEAMVDADVFIGLSGPGLLPPEHLRLMSRDPIVFPLSNPDPELWPEEIRELRPDAIIATGRSDYPNQINNVLGFPYIFRGALDVRASTINHEMLIACVKALRELTHEPVPAAVLEAYGLSELGFGPDYIIPKPTDPRLRERIPPAVARAAVDSGVARRSPPETSAPVNSANAEPKRPDADQPARRKKKKKSK